MSQPFTKEIVGFEHPAKGDDHCGQCVYFNACQHSCQIVMGDVLSQDWCRRFNPTQEAILGFVD